MQARRRAVPSVRQGLANGRRGRREALVHVAGGAMPLGRGLPPRFGARACSRAGIGLWVVTLKGVVVRAVGGCYDERDWVLIICRGQMGARAGSAQEASGRGHGQASMRGRAVRG